MVDLTAFKSKIEEAMRNMPRVCVDPRSEAIAVIESYGAQLQGSLKVGDLQRIKGERCKGSDKDFWYVYNELDDTQNDGRSIGLIHYGYWKDGTSEYWCSRTESQMTNGEREKFVQAREEMARQREAAEAIKNAEAAERAHKIWRSCPEATDDHPYLIEKGVGTTKGVRLANDGSLIIPIAVDGQISSLQFIKGDGEFTNKDGEPIGNKKMLYGGKKKGGWFIIEGENDVVYIAEGYSTARSVHEATGKTVYVCFDAGNIYEVASYVKSQRKGQIVIAGDDDTHTKDNAGRTKAEQAANGLGIKCTFPVGFNDFNDMHKELGSTALKKHFSLSYENLIAYENKDQPNNKVPIQKPYGIMESIYDYYNATSGNDQKGFALQTAIAVIGAVCGRSYRTNFDNYSNLYLLNVGKSATGKEHAKKIMNKILYSTKAKSYLSGDGYTSAGAVYSELLRKPNHITSIDEFGRYLEAGKAGTGNNTHQREANTKIMEAFGRGDDMMKPPVYSTMTLGKDAAKQVQDRYIHTPCISMLNMSTPDALYNSLDIRAIQDGFVNRFLIHISDAERSIRIHKESFDVPNNIKDWVNSIIDRYGKPHLATEDPKPITINFTTEASATLYDFQKDCIALQNKLDKYGMPELAGRANEIAMKLSLGVALSRDPYTDYIEKKDAQWAAEYVKRSIDATIEKLKMTISYSSFEQQKKEILSELRKLAKKGITRSDMYKVPPFSKYKKKDLDEILDALREADLAHEIPDKTGKRGRPTLRWIALK